ncbi:MAG: type II toxin-antitoxin system RelE/ParE family toxin [Candidatus Aenigmarchaeota archaeon]|nr:type II toxin-antitoxin system RelE/ParE family toxin [Candidatus Aenigmarchaeota archaeon]
MFRLLVEISVLEKINILLKKEANNIKVRLRALKANPFPDGKDEKEIKGSRRRAYRLRIGNYRFFYIIDIESKTVKVTEFLTAEQAHKIYGRM